MNLNPYPSDHILYCSCDDYPSRGTTATGETDDLIISRICVLENHSL